jgi:putative DNA-invertase from lambdoid prophage Rac
MTLWTLSSDIHTGQRVKADRFAPKVLKLVGEGQSYREISHRLGLSKNTVLDIVKRDRAA